MAFEHGYCTYPYMITRDKENISKYESIWFKYLLLSILITLSVQANASTVSCLGLLSDTGLNNITTNRISENPHFKVLPIPTTLNTVFNSHVQLTEELVTIYTSQLQSLGFETNIPFDILLVYDDSRLYDKINGDFTDDWGEKTVLGAHVTKDFDFAVKSFDEIQEISNGQAVMILPMQSSEKAQKTLSPGVISHELAHIFEPSYLTPKNLPEGSKNNGIRNGLTTWAEARAFLIDYLLTGNLIGADEKGTIYTNVEYPTVATLKEASPAFEAHYVGQFIAHIVFRLSKNKSKNWIASVVQTTDEILSGNEIVNPSIQITHQIDLAAIDFNVNSINEQLREKIEHGRRVRAESQLSFLEKVLLTLLIAVNLQDETSPADIRLAYKLITEYGFNFVNNTTSN